MIIVIQTLVFFRESLFAVLDRIFRPYVKHFALTFNRNNNVSDDEESEDHVFAEYDDEKGVIFCPPVYAQRYAAVSDCLMDERWCGKLEKVVDLGYHDMSFIKYLSYVPGVKQILGVDIESIPLQCSSDLFGSDEYAPKRETPLYVSLFQGNAADPDYRLIGCDAVIAIEMIEHMYPQDLERLVHTIFGFIKPWVAVITTPNGDFNPLFKSLEKNGFRRLDHFFEWSREQFHDWCSNIVVRYPNYTVSCRGVGPGPPDTLRYGCCSQLALFVSKDYHKQRDLNLNSLALVAKAPSTYNEIQALDFPDSECNMLCSPKNLESYTELVFSNKQSCATIVLSPAFSFESIEYRDKTSQCNIDKEIGKNFLMFNEEDSFAVVVPRRRRADNRIYIIEDVNCRLNCTTLQVKKFSKKTQHLMAKNKMHSLEHTKEVVDEIRHLTRMLNFNNESREAEGNHTWHNINWGENAPYWNQYYQLVKEYTYPFETKSEECRILDLISDEINRLVDMQYDDEIDVNKVEIPIHHLMRIVKHITDDVDRVRDLLEWNGYEIAGDVVIYSRLAMDTVSVTSHEDEWRDNDTFSDWDTDVRSTSLSASDGSSGPEGHGRSLYRALDQKVRTLRSMISNNEDISAELDKVVCRLTKLALRTARRRQQPLSNRWMQCKLLDLLNLTEKALGKKRQLYTENNPLKAICYDDMQMKMVHISKTNRNETASKLVDKYRHLVQSPEKTNASEGSRELRYDVMEDDLANVFLDQTSSTELNFEEMIRSPSLIDIEPISPVHSPKRYLNSKLIPLSCIKAWADGNDKVLVYSQNSSHCISSGDTDHSTGNIPFRNQKNNKKQKGSAGSKPDIDLGYGIKTPSKTSYGKRRRNRKSNRHHDNNKIAERNVKKKPSYNIIAKNSHQRLSAVDVKNYLCKAKKSYKHILKSHSRPISPTLIQFCTENTSAENEKDRALQESSTNSVELSPNNIDHSVAITKDSLLIDIVTEDNEETIALRRTVGTDAEDDLIIFEHELDETHGSMTNIMNIDSFDNKPDIGSERIHSQTLFLYDINEPSTSKGIRHVSMDVQCGPETNNNYAMLSTATSFTKHPQIFNAGLKIVNSFSDEQDNVINCDFGTSTNENFGSFKEINAKQRFTGIKIKDSETKITTNVETVTQETNTNPKTASTLNLVSTTETRILESVSSHYKIEDSGSELCDSLCSSQRSPLHFMNFAKDTSRYPIKLSEDVELENNFSNKYIRPKLSNGGVYVHSYKDRQISEDVVYQGDWQRYTTAAAPKKKSCNVVTKRTPELNKRIRNDYKDNANTNKNIRPATVKLVRNNNLRNMKQVKTIPSANNMVKVPNCNKNATKVASKLTSKRVILSKKSSTLIKKSSKTSIKFKTENEIAPRPRRKSYIPLYLKRKLASNNHPVDLDCGEKNEKVLVNKKVERNFDALKTVLLKFNPEPKENLNYVVFKNEIESNNHCSTDSENMLNTETGNDRRTDEDPDRSPSPQSFHSSAGSSPNSIATVRIRPKLRVADKRHSNSSNRSNQALFQTENTEVKNKKLTKKCKSVKKYHDNTSDNKENLPESSKKNKELVFNSNFSKNKSIFRAQITSENPQSTNNIVNKRKSSNKTNIKIPSVPSSTGKQSICGTSAMPSLSPENKSRKNTKITVNSISQDSEKEQNSVIINIVDNNLLTEWMNTTQNDVVESQTSNIQSAMRQLVEERLEFIERFTDNDAEVYSRAVQMSDRCNSVSASDTTSFHDATSLNSSYGTVVMDWNDDYDYTQIMDWNEMDLDNIFFDSVVYNEYDPVVGDDSIIGITVTKPNVTDLELLSFKSIASAAKVSEYFLAEGSPNNESDLQNSVTPADNCVRDIFERKGPLSIESPAGRLAIQAFSGLSMNTAPVVRDVRDQVNLVDSETGSIARDHIRQTTSEEVFVSGRSSGSFDSCMIDEDAVVPDWLFQIISQQQALEDDEDENDDEDEDEEEESEHLIPVQLPLAEPIFDVNGNIIEPGMGAGAGAGDGRGIHSDHSQDSSGRGTSLSSSVTSSGPQSEAILIDPTAFSMPYDLIREPASSLSIIVPQLPTHFEAADSSRATAEGPMNSRNTAIVNSSGDPQIVPVRAASDIDADISSIDTDVPDSSDN